LIRAFNPADINPLRSLRISL